jgi:hypothetical protein
MPPIYHGYGMPPSYGDFSPSNPPPSLLQQQQEMQMMQMQQQMAHQQHQQHMAQQMANSSQQMAPPNPMGESPNISNSNGHGHNASANPNGNGNGNGKRASNVGNLSITIPMTTMAAEWDASPRSFAPAMPLPESPTNVPFLTPSGTPNHGIIFYFLFLILNSRNFTHESDAVAAVHLHAPPAPQSPPRPLWLRPPLAHNAHHALDTFVTGNFIHILFFFCRAFVLKSAFLRFDVLLGIFTLPF